MSTEFKRLRRHKATSKQYFIFPILCLLFFGTSIWINSISQSYTFKIKELLNEIKAMESEKTEIEAKNKNLKTSISELDSQIKEIEVELNYERR